MKKPCTFLRMWDLSGRILKREEKPLLSFKNLKILLKIENTFSKRKNTCLCQREVIYLES